MRKPKIEGVPFYDDATNKLQDRIGDIDRLYIKLGFVNTPMLSKEDAHEIQALLRELTRCLVFEVMERQKEEKRKKRKEQK